MPGSTERARRHTCLPPRSPTCRGQGGHPSPPCEVTASLQRRRQGTIVLWLQGAQVSSHPSLTPVLGAPPGVCPETEAGTREKAMSDSGPVHLGECPIAHPVAGSGIRQVPGTRLVAVNKTNRSRSPVEDRRNQEGTQIVWLRLANNSSCNSAMEEKCRQMPASECRTKAGMWWYHKGERGQFPSGLGIRSRGGELQLNLEGWEQVCGARALE